MTSPQQLNEPLLPLKNFHTEKTFQEMLMMLFFSAVEASPTPNRRTVSLYVLKWTVAYRACSPVTRMGPMGAGPQQKSSGPRQNIWTDHVPSGLPDKNFGILWHFWY